MLTAEQIEQRRAYKRTWEEANRKKLNAMRKARDRERRKNGDTAFMERQAAAQRAYYARNKARILARLRAMTPEERAHKIEIKRAYRARLKNRPRKCDFCWVVKKPDQFKGNATTCDPCAPIKAKC